MMIENERNCLTEVAGYYEKWGGIKGAITLAAGRLIASRVKGSRGLEMGWGPGVMHDSLAEALSVLDVIEGDAMLARKAQTTMTGSAGKVFACMFEDFETAPVYSDIIMASILEHVTDPGQILRRATGWLAEGGSIHVVVPNGHSLHRLLGCLGDMLNTPTDFTEGDRMVEHRRVYTWASLRREIESAGLEIVHMEGILLKPFPWRGMDMLTEAEISRLFELAPCCPQLCAEVYTECRVRRESC